MYEILFRIFLKSAASAVAGYMTSSYARSPMSKSDSMFPKDVYKQNSVINQKAVDETLNACAVALSRKSSSDEAWATIFQKPSQKAWQEVKTAGN